MSTSKVEIKETKSDKSVESKETKETKEESKEEPKGLDALADETETVELVCKKDGSKATVIVKHAKISVLFKTAMDTDADTKEIPVLGGIDGVTFKDLVSYMNEYKGVAQKIIDKPLRSKVMKDVTSEWSAKFIDDIGEDRQRLYNFILGANYLDISCALHLGCAKVASLIKGQPLEKIKEILSKGITPKEVEDTVMSYEKKEEKKEEKKA